MMAESDMTNLIHVIARVDKSNNQGAILYVNPAQMRSNAAPEAALDAREYALVLRNPSNEEIGRVYPQVRYSACVDGEDAQQGLIQQDIELIGDLSVIELERNGAVLDRFQQNVGGTDNVSLDDANAGLVMEAGIDADDHRIKMSTAGITDSEGTSFLVQALPDNGTNWQTLAVGRKTPDFELDKNQFPGAKNVKVRVMRNVGFKQDEYSSSSIDIN
jgi:hypothetical protein